MRLDCPRCGHSLEYSEVPPRFCSNCGLPLSVSEQTAPTLPAPPVPSESTIPAQPVDGLATLVYPVGRSRPPHSHPENIGGYQLLRALGGGGMGTVYEAEERATGRRVAVKLIRPEFADSRDTVERFRREGKLASALFHPRCVFVLTADEEAGRPYIVMELMPGKNLNDLVEQNGPLPVAEAVRRILDVIEGLQEAHRLGVIHRDVKPSNCFLDVDGRVKVGDFGLAKSLVGPEQLTRSGSFLGTVLYASPEQIKNEEVNHQTDVYSVCATLYFLLTGRAPFQAEDPAAALARAVSDPVPSMRTFRKEIPRTLDEVVLRGLARSRRGRWQSLEELRLALLPFVESPQCIPELGWRVTAYLCDMLLLIPFELGTQRLLLWLAGEQTWGSWTLLYAMLASLSCGFVYFAVPEWLLGWTPGKFLTRLRVRDSLTQDRPSLWRSLLRTFWFYLFKDTSSLLAALIMLGVGGSLFREGEIGLAIRLVMSIFLVAVLPILLGGVGLGILASTMRRRNGYRGVHEFFSRTRVLQLPSIRTRFRAPAKATWPARGPLPDGVPSRVGICQVHAVAHATPEEMVLQGQEVALHRPVWLWLRRDSAQGLSLPRMEAARDSRPRWLSWGMQDGWRWDAFVAVPGCALAELLPKRGRLGWRDALSILEALAQELADSEQEGSLPDRLSPEQIWVQGSGRVMLLDAPPRPPTLVATPMDLLRQAAALILEGKTRTSSELYHPIRAPIPGHASELLGRLMGSATPFANLAEARAELSKAHELPEEISRPGKAIQVGLALVGISPGLLLMFTLGPLLLLGAYLICVVGAAEGEYRLSQLEECLVRPEDQLDLDDGRKELLAEQQAVQRDLKLLAQDREIVLASWSWFMVRGMGPIEARTRQAYGAILAGAEDDQKENKGFYFLLDNFFLDNSDNLLAGPSAAAREALHKWWLVELLLFWPLVWAIWAGLTRGGFALRLAGIRLVGADGRPAARWRCALRALIVWLPVALLLLAAVHLDVWRIASARQGWSPDAILLCGWLSWHLWWGAMVLLVGYIFLAILYPNGGPHDRLTNVYPVPR